MGTRKGRDAAANARFRAKRRRAHGDARSVPGGHKVANLCRPGTTEPARAGKGERKLLQAWDNQGGTGLTVEWKDGRTQLRKMAPSGELPLAEVFPHTEPGFRTITQVVKGKIVITKVRLSTDATVNGDCYNVGAPKAGDSRPDRWSEHGSYVDGNWQAGARFNTEKLAFSFEVDRGK